MYVYIYTYNIVIKVFQWSSNVISDQHHLYARHSQHIDIT